MPKRFTATEKWDDTWFSGLKPKYKLMWFFLLDKCDHAGIIDFNIRMANFCTGFENTTEEVIEVFKDKIVVLDSRKWFIKKFIDYQYKGRLKPGVIAQKSVLEILERENIPVSMENGSVVIDKDELIAATGRVSKGLGKSSETVQDKEKEKDEDEDMDKKKEIGKETSTGTDAEKYTVREGIESLIADYIWMKIVKTNPQHLKKFGAFLIADGCNRITINELKTRFTLWKEKRDHCN